MLNRNREVIKAMTDSGEELKQIDRAFTESQSRAVMHSSETLREGKRSITVSLSGALDGENSASFLSAMKQHIDLASQEQVSTLLLDLKGLSYASSAGIGIFISVLTVAKTEGIDLALSNLSEKVRGVFKLLGFESFFTIL
jgi:anti-sigma B factor antagonist